MSRDLRFVSRARARQWFQRSVSYHSESSSSGTGVTAGNSGSSSSERSSMSRSSASSTTSPSSSSAPGRTDARVSSSRQDSPAAREAAAAGAGGRRDADERPGVAEPILDAGALVFARLAGRAARFGAAAFLRPARGRFGAIVFFAVDLRLAAVGFLRAVFFGLTEARRAET